MGLHFPRREVRLPDRVLMIGLDGYESSIGDRLMAEGRLPNLKAMREASARWDIDDKLNRKTGLTLSLIHI